MLESFSVMQNSCDRKEHASLFCNLCVCVWGGDIFNVLQYCIMCYYYIIPIMNIFFIYDLDAAGFLAINRCIHEWTGLKFDCPVRLLVLVCVCVCVCVAFCSELVLHRLEFLYNKRALNAEDVGDDAGSLSQCYQDRSLNAPENTCWCCMLW